MTQYQLFPDLTPEEYAELKASIAERGVLVPIELDENGAILDGHHRLHAWQELRAAGVKVADYPRLVRVGMTEAEKRQHVRVLNMLRRQLTPEQRKAQMIELRKDGMGLQEIAKAAGVSVGTVHAATNELFNSEKLPGADGKARPTHYKKREKPTTIFAGTNADEKRALSAADALDAAPAHTITTSRAARIAREQIAVERASVPQADTATGNVQIYLGDFRERGADLLDASVDLIFTDPPYPEEFNPLWSDLSAFAARVLKPDGILIAYTGAMYLPEVYQRLGEHLQYWWQGALILGGQHARVYARQVSQGSKPILFYVKPGGKARAWCEDTYHSEGEVKTHHDWQQSIGAAEYYIKTFTQPGDLVVDPYLGSGTTAVACLNTGRRFVGYEIDLVAFAAANASIEQARG